MHVQTQPDVCMEEGAEVAEVGEAMEMAVAAEAGPAARVGHACVVIGEWPGQWGREGGAVCWCCYW